MVIDNHNLRDKVQFLPLMPYSVRCGLEDNISRHMPSVAEVYKYSDLASALASKLGAVLNSNIQLRARALTVKIRKNNE